VILFSLSRQTSSFRETGASEMRFFAFRSDAHDASSWMNWVHIDHDASMQSNNRLRVRG
jgi:hypothetical protein